MTQNQLPPEIVQAIRDGKWVFKETQPENPHDPEFWYGDDPVDAPDGWEVAYAPREEKNG